MCRWAAYSGKPLFIEEIIAAPSHSLIEQSHAASECKTAINGDGFGVAWYGEHEEPGIYSDILPAWSDRNLRNIARMVKSPLFLAHVRASTGSPTSRQNCHPFSNGKWSFMHNGQIRDFEKLRRPLQAMLDDELYNAQRGSTDSELLFLLALQNGLDKAPQGALAKTVEIIEDTARELDLQPLVRLTAAFSDGKRLFAVRYSSDEIAPTLYVSDNTVSHGICLVSEPLDEHGPNWRSIDANQFVTIEANTIKSSGFIGAPTGMQNLKLVSL
jgi:glutamine amidotransferase